MSRLLPPHPIQNERRTSRQRLGSLGDFNSFKHPHLQPPRVPSFKSLDLLASLKLDSSTVELGNAYHLRDQMYSPIDHSMSVRPSASSYGTQPALAHQPLWTHMRSTEEGAFEQNLHRQVRPELSDWNPHLLSPIEDSWSPLAQSPTSSSSSSSSSSWLHTPQPTLESYQQGVYRPHIPQFRPPPNYPGGFDIAESRWAATSSSDPSAWSRRMDSAGVASTISSRHLISNIREQKHDERHCFESPPPPHQTYRTPGPAASTPLFFDLPPHPFESYATQPVTPSYPQQVVNSSSRNYGSFAEIPGSQPSPNGAIPVRTRVSHEADQKFPDELPGWASHQKRPDFSPEAAVEDAHARLQVVTQVSSARRRDYDQVKVADPTPVGPQDKVDTPFPSFDFSCDSVNPSSLALNRPSTEAPATSDLRTHSATVAAFSSYQRPTISEHEYPHPISTSQTSLTPTVASSFTSPGRDAPSPSFATSSVREERQVARPRKSRSPSSQSQSSTSKNPRVPATSQVSRKRKASYDYTSSDDLDDVDQRRTPPSPAQAPVSPYNGVVTKSEENLLVAWDDVAGRFLPADQAPTSLERILLTDDEFSRVWVAAKGGRGGGPKMVEIFPWTDDGLAWIQGQFHTRPACPCGMNYYYESGSRSSKPKIKAGGPLCQHFVVCSRVPESGLKRLCRKLENECESDHKAASEEVPHREALRSAASPSTLFAHRL
ncbi:hypothetical protein RQP46_005702 [Phenoliferia psychrophenolica]